MVLFHWFSTAFVVSYITYASALPQNDQKERAQRDAPVARNFGLDFGLGFGLFGLGGDSRGRPSGLESGHPPDPDSGSPSDLGLDLDAGADVDVDLDLVVQIDLPDFTSLEDFAEELSLDVFCLVTANPLLGLFGSWLGRRRKVNVPYRCCGTSCRGSVCSRRPQCQGQSTAPPQPSGTAATTIGTVIVTVDTSSSAITSGPIPVTIGTGISSSSNPAAGTTSNPAGTSSNSDTGTASIPAGTSSIPGAGTAGASSVPGGTSSIPGAGTTGASGNPAGTSNNPGGIASTLDSGTASNPSTTTDPAGQTIISDTSGAVTLPTGISSSIITLPGGSVITFQPTSASPPAGAPGLVTSTAPNGATVISGSSGAVTLPTGLSTSTVVTLPGGSVITFVPPPSAQISSSSSVLPGLITTTAPNGATVISGSSGAVTLPTGLSSSTIVTLPGGSVVTFVPPAAAQTTSSSSVLPGLVTTTAPNGATVISGSSGAVTLPTGLSTSTIVTLPGGSVVTFIPPPRPGTTTSSSSMVIPPGFIFPVLTSVPAPKTSDGGQVVPCNLWFFSICIRFGGIDIQGWDFNFPPGIRPPGPPPSITFPPELSISVSISGTLPPWPAITIGSGDHLPTFEPKPTDGPDNECETKSAEVCLTSTSVSVSSTVTTSTVISTCATVFGCDVEDTATTTATTTTASTSTQREICAPTADPNLGRVRRAVKQRDLSARNLTKRDIPHVDQQDAYATYEQVAGDANTNIVPLGTIATGEPPANAEEALDRNDYGFTSVYFKDSYVWSTNRFQPFLAEERNMYLRGLAGCTSVIVVSRRGAWVSHLWEESFLAYDLWYQRTVIDFLNAKIGLRVREGIFSNSAQNPTSIFIVTPATYQYNLEESSSETDKLNGLTLSLGDPLFSGSPADGDKPAGPDLIEPIIDALGNLIPGVVPQVFNYARYFDAPGDTAYGKAMVLFSNDQKFDPDSGSGLTRPPNKATWQVWMQARKLGQDLWDATPEQGGTCPANQKRQAGGQCSPRTTLGVSSSSTSSSSSSSRSSSLSSSSASSSSSSFTGLPNLPTLTTAAPVTTPSGQTCVFTSSTTNCALGPGGQTACVSSTFCGSFAPITTSSSSPPPPRTTTTSAAPPPPPPPGIELTTYKDSDCKDVRLTTQLAPGDCASFSNSIPCFRIGTVSDDAKGATLTVYSVEQCQPDPLGNTPQEYRNVGDLENTNQHPGDGNAISLFLSK